MIGRLRSDEVGIRKDNLDGGARQSDGVRAGQIRQDNLLGDAKDYLVENLPVQVLYAEGKAVQVELPSSVQLKIIEAPEGLRGDTASNVTKPAVLETGKTVNVPLFIQEGETVKIDTRTGAYMGRA